MFEEVLIKSGTMAFLGQLIERVSHTGFRSSDHSWSSVCFGFLPVWSSSTATPTTMQLQVLNSASCSFTDSEVELQLMATLSFRCCEWCIWLRLIVSHVAVALKHHSSSPSLALRFGSAPCQGKMPVAQWNPTWAVAYSVNTAIETPILHFYPKCWCRTVQVM